MAMAFKEMAQIPYTYIYSNNYHVDTMNVLSSKSMNTQLCFYISQRNREMAEPTGKENKSLLLVSNFT